MWLLHRFAYESECGKVHHRFDVVLLDSRHHSIRIVKLPFY